MLLPLCFVCCKDLRDLLDLQRREHGVNLCLHRAHRFNALRCIRLFSGEQRRIARIRWRRRGQRLVIAAHARAKFLELGPRSGKDALDLCLLLRGEIQLLQYMHEASSGTVVAVPMMAVGGWRRRIARSRGMDRNSRKAGARQSCDYNRTGAVHSSRWRVHQNLLKGRVRTMPIRTDE